MRILLVLLAACTVSATQFTPDEAKPASLSLSPAGDLALGVVVLGRTSGRMTMFLSNDGDQDSGLIAISVGDTTLGFVVSDDECSGAPLAGRRTCSFALQFTPAIAAAVQTNMHVSASPGGELSKLVLATGLVPGQIDITESSYNFLGMALGASQKTAVFTVRALGQTQLGKPVPAIDSDTASYIIQSTTCETALAPGDSCKVTVAFAPAAVGERAASLTVSAGPDDADALTMSGLGFARVAVAKTGMGAVISQDAGLDCGAICAADVATSPITLTAMPGANASFAGWTAGCSGTGPCTLQLTGAKSVGAAFTCNTGYGACGIGGACTSTMDDASNCGACGNACAGVTNGFGVCTSSQCGLACTTGYSMCSAACVDLTSDPNNCGMCGHACPGTACSASQCLPPGMVDIEGTAFDFGIVTAATTATHTFTIKNAGTTTIGMPVASVGTSDPSYTISSTNCPSTLAPGATCTVIVAFRPTTAGSKAGSLGVGAVPGGSDAITLSGTGRARITVSKSGSGTITSQPAGINCGATCAADFTATSVTLTSDPAVGYSFAGWSFPGCAGTSCTIDPTAPVTVTATFTVNAYPVIVDVTSPLGSMSGNFVAGDGAGNACTAASCTFTYGAPVTLTAIPDAYSRFVGWQTGPCAGSTATTCSFTMPAGQVNVSAQFDWFATFSIRPNRGRVNPFAAPRTTRAFGSVIDCPNTTTLMTGTCGMHPPRNGTYGIVYASGAPPNNWSACPLLFAQASGDCQPQSGPISNTGMYVCNMTFANPGDYTSEYDVFCGP